MNYIPVIKACELLLPPFVPLTSSFQIFLIVQPATYRAATGQPLTDVFPLHATAAKLDDESVLLG